MHEAKRVALILSLVKGPRVLDIGCVANSGVPQSAERRRHWLHGRLKEAGFDLTGADIVQDGLTEMQQLGYDVIELDAEQIPPGGEKFDTIIAGELVEHLTNLGGFLDGTSTRLKPGGRLIITTPNPWCLQWFLQYIRNVDTAFHPEHAAWLDPQTLRQALERHGYRVSERRFVNDLGPKGSVGLKFGAYRLAFALFGRFVPERLSNCHVTVAEPVDS